MVVLDTINFDLKISGATFERALSANIIRFGLSPSIELNSLFTKRCGLFAPLCLPPPSASPVSCGYLPGINDKFENHIDPPNNDGDQNPGIVYNLKNGKSPNSRIRPPLNARDNSLIVPSIFV
jgi:hypothetical protein